MKKFVYCALLTVSAAAFAQSVAEFNPNNLELTIPEVKVGADMVYNAKLKLEGPENFKLLSYENTSPNIPPVGKAMEMEQWLAKGIYKSWACEADKHPQTGSSPHGVIRTCSNPMLSKSLSGSYPIGSASVKELYTGDNVTGYAIGVKIKAGDGADTWYWYEKFGANVVVDAAGHPMCEGCHAKAPRDRVFVRL